MRDILLFILLVSILLGIGWLLIGEKRNAAKSVTYIQNPADYEYYWSTDCPHCSNVSAFLAGWEGLNKIKLDKFEINATPANSRKYADRGRFCGIPQNQMAVPLLITPDGLCVSGDQTIIDYLKSLPV